MVTNEQLQQQSSHLTQQPQPQQQQQQQPGVSDVSNSNDSIDEVDDEVRPMANAAGSPPLLRASSNRAAPEGGEAAAGAAVGRSGSARRAESYQVRIPNVTRKMQSHLLRRFRSPPEG